MNTLTKPANTRSKLDYHTIIKTKASASEAFNKINDVPAWWSKNFEGTAQKLNDVYTVRFTVEDGVIWKNFKVVESVPHQKIVWEVTDCHMPWLANKKEWQGTQLVWEISSDDNSTQIDFTHVGLTPEVECFSDCNRGWNFFIHESLLKLLNENQGDRTKRDQLSGREENSLKQEFTPCPLGLARLP